MNEQKTRSKLNWVGSGDSKNDESLIKIANTIKQKHNITDLLYYQNFNNLEIKAKILYLQKVQDNYIIITDKTIFYPEGGGQVGDCGEMIIDSINIKIHDTKKIDDIVFHFINQQNADKLKINDINFINKEIIMLVNSDKRKKTSANHTATHLLHHALRLKLGNSVFQKGSYVDDIKLRFDFSYNKALTFDEIQWIEFKINQWIISNTKINIGIENKDDAIQNGVMALFGEKYDDKVRVVKVQNEDCKSMEFCGGTHVSSLGEIGLFKITSEAGIGGGIRRIEAKTGLEALNFVSSEMQKLYSAMQEHKIQNIEGNPLSKAISNLKNENKILQNTLLDSQSDLLLIHAKNNITIHNIFDIVSIKDLSISQANITLVINKKYAKVDKTIIFEYLKDDKQYFYIKLSKDFNKNSFEPILDEFIKQKDQKMQYKNTLKIYL